MQNDLLPNRDRSPVYDAMLLDILSNKLNVFITFIDAT